MIVEERAKEGKMEKIRGMVTQRLGQGAVSGKPHYRYEEY